MEGAVAVNWLAVVVAAVVKFVIGGIWFMPLFGKRWRALQDIPEGASMSGLGTAMTVQVVGDLVMAYILARFIGHYGATTLGDGVLIGFMAWLGFVATIMAGAIYYQRRKAELVVIEAGYQLVGIVVMGAILALWR